MVQLNSRLTSRPTPELGEAVIMVIARSHRRAAAHGSLSLL